MKFVQPDEEHETKRLEALHSLAILGSERGPEFDAVVQIAADIFDCGISLISLVGEEEQWFKACYGLEEDRTPRKVSFCQHAIEGDDLFVIPDATKDPRFEQNPLVTGEPHVRFYAGYPLTLDGEYKLGTLCAIDNKPKTPTEFQLKQLARLGKIVEGQLSSYRLDTERRAALKQADEAHQSAISKGELLEEITTVSGVGGWEYCLNPPELTWTDKTREIHEVPEDHKPQLDNALSYYPPHCRHLVSEAIEKALGDGTSWDLELPFRTAKNRDLWVRAVGHPIQENGEVVRVIGAFQDITERKKIETQLAENERLARHRSEELEAILANLRQGVSVFDSNGRLTMWNQRYLDIFDKPRNEVYRGARLVDLIKAEQKRGEFQGDVQEHILDLTIRLSSGEIVKSKFTHPSGRIISAVHTPLPGGGWIGTHEDVTTSELAVQKIEHAAHHDTLTGLANRTLFNSRLAKAITEAHARGVNGELMLLDLDIFKQVNDTFGHDAGDELLIQVAHRLEDCVRSSDLVARLGGDEFGVILSNSTRSAARSIADRIVERMRTPFDIFGNMIELSVSAGISEITADTPNANTIVKNADIALYNVKKNGRNAYEFHGEASSTRVA